MSKSELNGNTATTANAWDIAAAINAAGWFDLLLLHAAIQLADLWWGKSEYLGGSDLDRWMENISHACELCNNRFRAMRGYLPWECNAPKVVFGPKIEAEIDKKITTLAERVWREGDFSQV